MASQKAKPEFQTSLTELGFFLDKSAKAAADDFQKAYPNEDPRPSLNTALSEGRAFNIEEVVSAEQFVFARERMVKAQTLAHALKRLPVTFAEWGQGTETTAAEQSPDNPSSHPPLVDVDDIYALNPDQLRHFPFASLTSASGYTCEQVFGEDLRALHELLGAMVESTTGTESRPGWSADSDVARDLTKDFLERKRLGHNFNIHVAFPVLKKLKEILG